MSKKKNHTLENLLRTDIFDSFHERLDKHSIKADGGGEGLIFSYGYRNNLLDTVGEFAKYMKTEFPEIRRPSQLTAYHAEAWIAHKAACGDSKASIATYRANMKKIGHVISAREHVDVDLAVGPIATAPKRKSSRGAKAVISGQDYAKILDYCVKSKSGSAVAIRLERLIGVRVGDAAYGIYVHGDKLDVYSKHNKICTRPITAEIKAILAEPTTRRLIRSDGHIDFPKDDSINKFLKRVQEKMGLERHSFHDLRRYVAQGKYDEYRRGGMTRQQALAAVGLWLNHGEHREDLVLESYVANAW